MAKGGTQIVGRRRGLGFFPVDEAGEDLMRAVPLGRNVMATITAPRNVDQERRIHALLRLVADNHPEFTSVDAIRRFLKQRSGMFTEFVGINPRTGATTVFYELKSTSFASMDQTEFNRVWQQWKDIICRDLLPGIRDAALEEEVLRAL